MSEQDDLGASVGPGSRASTEPSGLGRSGFDPSRISLLWASQGEYSDRQEWPIAVYENDELAQADVDRGTALYRQLFVAGRYELSYATYDEQAALWASPEGCELAAILGGRCSTGDELYLTCAAIEFRSAQAIETRRAETGTGSVADESAVPTACAHDPADPSLAVGRG